MPATRSLARHTSFGSWIERSTALTGAFLFLVFAAVAACSQPQQTSHSRSADFGVVTVEAGGTDRLQTPISFELENGPRLAALIDDAGRYTPLQIGPDGRYHFLLDRLEKGRSQTFHIVSATVAAEPPVLLSNNGRSVGFATPRGPFIRYNFEPTDLPRKDVDPVFRRGGYLHPVFSPAGVLLTDDYPPDHLHHHGLWAAWTRTEFEGRSPDFWNVGDGTGTVEPTALDTVFSGPVFSGLRARHAYVDLSAPTPTKALDETWAIRVYGEREDGIRLFDLEVVQTTGEGSELRLPEYRYGGVGFRGHRQWNGEDNAEFLTAEGLDRSNGHGTRANWCHIGGSVDGHVAGIAVLDHPENFRSPQPMRIHPTEPFFNYAPSQLGDWSIEPGSPYTARYRFLTYDGEPDAELIDRLWNDFARPPVVSVEPSQSPNR